MKASSPNHPDRTKTDPQANHFGDAKHNPKADIQQPSGRPDSVEKSLPQDSSGSRSGSEPRTFLSCIHPDRYPKPVPDSLVDADGKCRFGTFDKEFPAFHLEKAKSPTSLPDAFNSLKLTLWQAAEVHLQEGILLCAVCDMGLFGKVLMVYYDKETHEVYTFDSTLPSSAVKIADNLLKGSRSIGEGPNCELSFLNLLDRDKARITGHSAAKGHTIKFDFSLQRLSPPSVVSIPFGENRPLYSQKDFLKATGSLTINGRKIHTTLDSTGLLDDHKGYYPRRSHYDWVTAMGINTKADVPGWFAVNLTKNQTIDPERFNENLIWVEDHLYPLPPVHYEKSGPISRFKKEKDVIWKVKDDHGMVDLQFDILGVSPMVLHAGIVNIDYYIFFGELHGILKDAEGHVYPVEHMTAIGEDKTLLF